MEAGVSGPRIHPAAVLYAGGKPFPTLAACEHYAGSEKLITKALQIQAESTDTRPVFDITADCEDGAPAGHEREHATMIATLIAGADNRFDRVGARIHDVRHPAWREELDVLVSQAGRQIAYLVLPKCNAPTTRWRRSARSTMPVAATGSTAKYPSMC